MANGTGSTTWTSPSGVRRGDKASTECSSHTVALPVEDLHDSVRVSTTRHRVMDTTGICQGPGAGQRGLLTEHDARRCLHLRPTADQGTARVSGQGNRPGM